MTGRAEDTPPACTRIRLAVSARLDGEPLEMSAAVLADHLTRCRACAAWAADVTRIGRTVRVRSERIPDLTDAIMAGVDLPTRPRRLARPVIRMALAVVGFAQLVIAAPDLFDNSMGMHMAAHAAHESAAWNAALGAAFIFTALRPHRAAGLLPLLAAFILVLTIMSSYDLATGAVEATRLLTHLGAVIGLVLVAALNRRPVVETPRRGLAETPASWTTYDPPRDLPGVA